jgi:hypothetical protein
MNSGITTMRCAVIINLETTREETASYILSEFIQEAIETKDRNLIRRIRRLWRYDVFGRGSKNGERWSEIKKKCSVEGSTWYVWWMDGVRAFMRRKNEW